MQHELPSLSLRGTKHLGLFGDTTLSNWHGFELGCNVPKSALHRLYESLVASKWQIGCAPKRALESETRATARLFIS